MLPGPVFNFELMGTARRSRFYLVRAFYAVVLFLILWGVHSAWTSENGGELDSRIVAWFAFSAFCAITIGQQILVLLFTPALVAGVIADAVAAGLSFHVRPALLQEFDDAVQIALRNAPMVGRIFARPFLQRGTSR